MKKSGYILACCIGVACALVYPQKAYAGVTEGIDDTAYVELVDNREYSDLVIAQVSEWVNIRKGPGTDTEILGKLYNNSVGHYIDETDGWVQIQSGSVTGYVSSEYVVKGVEALKIAKDVEVTYATIDTGTLNVRKEANTHSAILGTFSRGDELVVKGTEEGFAKVTYNNKNGYISLEYVQIHTEFVEAESLEEERARKEAEEKARKEAEAAARAALAAEQARAQAAAVSATAQLQAASDAVNTDSSLGQQVVDYACQFIGNPYRYGGTSLTNGSDCSGFVMSVYAHFGVKLPRTGQRASGYAIGSLDQALPGDIICYSGHVGIYMGNGQIVHAATPRDGICITNANYTTIIGIRRIF